jgi:molybdopterin-guanine dinucleotide biosynthesis protein A
MFDVAGFILVGGASSRMGSDKAELVFNGRTSLELIAAQLSAAVTSVALVGARQEYRRLGLKNVPDLTERWGALGGIHAALAATDKEWAAIVACDLPFVTGDLFAHLMSLIDETNDAVVPLQPDGRPQPLCALYRRKTCLPEVDKLIAEGEHTPRALLANVKTHWVEFDKLQDLPGAANFFFNVNTPAEFELAQKIFKERAPR